MVAGKLPGKPIDHRPMPLAERMKCCAVAGGRPGYEV